jgi:ABC-type phosphate transport system substrate-binding protein
MKIFLIITTTFVLFASTLFAQSAKHQVIVNKDNSISSLSKNQLKKIYTKKMTKWEDGSKIKPIDLQKSSEVRSSFSDNVLKKSISAMRAFWQRQIFSGKGVPPPEKKSDADVIEYVKNNPGAIGYVSANANISGVKKITVKSK